MACLMDLPDYSFYKSEYGGTVIAQAEFDRLAIQSEHQLKRYERAYAITYPAVEGKPQNYNRLLTICSLADEIRETERATLTSGGVVRSESIGSVSVSYESGVSAEKTLETKHKRYFSAIQTFADVYRGAR